MAALTIIAMKQWRSWVDWRKEAEYKEWISGKKNPAYSVNWEVRSREMQLWRVKKLKKSGNFLKVVSSEHNLGTKIPSASLSWYLENQADLIEVSFSKKGSHDRASSPEGSRLQVKMGKREKFRNCAFTSRDEIRKSKAQVELRLVRNIKSNRGSIYWSIGTSRLKKEHWGEKLGSYVGFKEKVFYSESGEALTWIAQRCVGSSVPVDIQHKAGPGSEQSVLSIGVPVHCRGLGLDVLQRSLPTPNDSVILLNG